jgi:predicted NBD/HSP70 family sugar kinase/biotin operon repressor
VNSSERRILRLILERGTISQAEIASEALLSRTTVWSAVRALRDRKLVMDVDTDGAGLSVVGRPSLNLKLADSAGLAVGIEVDKSYVRVAAARLGGEEIPRDDRVDVRASHGYRECGPVEVAAYNSYEETLTMATHLIHQVLSEMGETTSRVAGVVMGIPAPVDRIQRRVAWERILPAWAGREPERDLQRRLGEDIPVEVENDANLGALGETLWGAGRGFREVVYIKSSSGVGCGIVVNGSLFRGAMGTAGELGHVMVTVPSLLTQTTLPCPSCMKKGCLEALAGEQAIIRSLGGTGDLTLGKIIEGARAGNNVYQAALAQAGEYLSIAVVNLFQLLDPDCVVVSGLLSDAGDWVLKPIRDLLRSRVEYRPTARVVRGSLGTRAQVIGALSLVMRRSDDRFIDRLLTVAG